MVVAAMRDLFAGLRLAPGDWWLLACGLLAIVWLAAAGPGRSDRVVIRQAGQVYSEHSLRLNAVIDVPGPLGLTRVEIRDGRVRVLADPSPRQLCVQRGWLRPGEVAVCLPNRVSVELGQARYDSLNH